MQIRPTIVLVSFLLLGSTTFAEETRESEIDTFDSVQQNNDYRVSLLSVTKGVAFLDSQELVSDGNRTPGNNVVPWMRVATVVEKLTDKEEPWACCQETQPNNSALNFRLDMSAA